MDYETVVVGAGVVGLAVAARLAPRGPLLVVERHDGIVQETSSRNSEVVHAGIYYPAGSVKARACVRGKELLYARCDALGIDAPRVGKYIVAVDEGELAPLQALASKAAANGVDDLRWLDAADLRREQPELAGRAALFSPSTGIVDSHRFAASFQAEAEAAGATVALRTELVAVDPLPSGYRLHFVSGGEPGALTARRVVNAAGLGQDVVSSLAGIDVDAAGYRTFPCKGAWCSIAPRHRGRVSSLVYPVGSAKGGGLGVHLCLDTGGGMRLGPDIHWVERSPDGFDLSVRDEVVPAFLAAGQRLMPFLEAGDLQPELAGVRAKLVPGAGMWTDFVVAEESGRGLPGWITLAGIESPGLTAAMALAELVERL